MQLGIESQIPDGLLAANALLAGNSRQGVPTSTHTLHPGFEFAISSTYKGFQFGCAESASDPVVAPSKPATPPLTPQQQHAQQQEQLNKKCAAANMASGALWVTAGLNEGAAWLTGGVTPFSAIFHGIALGEGIAAGGVSIYAGYVCYQATQ